MPTPIPVALTDVQTNTLTDLVRARRRSEVGSARVLAERLEAALARSGLRDPIVLTKARLTDAGRCEGRFDAALRREGPPFEHSSKTAGGLLLHKAVELDVGGRIERDAHELVEIAAGRLADDDRAFSGYWHGLDDIDRDQLLMRAMTALVLFRETFPPLRHMRARLAPMTEWRLRAELAEAALILDGRIDLSLGRPSDDDGRLLLDIKGEGAWPEHAEDLRFYALVHLLRFGVAPSRVASVFLASGTWQVEDVTDRTISRAADRIEAALAVAGRLAAGEQPVLRPGRYCAWCPRAASCPASASAS
ncbi:MAG: PD-(D/E)XK nuclease family protein [Actinomycetota bacterium]